jgi:hypothetical protein
VKSPTFFEFSPSKIGEVWFTRQTCASCAGVDKDLFPHDDELQSMGAKEYFLLANFKFWLKWSGNSKSIKNLTMNSQKTGSKA